VATSGTINSRMTAAEIVAAAMQELGLLAAGEDPEGSELQVGLRTLNWMLKTWAQAEGINLWREEQGSVVFSPYQATATLDPFCLDLLEARVVVTPPTEILSDDTALLVDG
jgi:hypothetical protein